MQKVKDTLKKVTGKGHEHETGYANTGAGYGASDYNANTAGYTTGTTGVTGTESYGSERVEDRPIVKERVERILEHAPVEKQYVVETKFVGETAVPSSTGATVIDTNERVVERAEPGPACPTGVGAAMDRVIDETRRY
ncbi:hypothetical protein COO60DRAFT_78118 [Scenedesmus sp. NREL 46B-D3]|nr:hypothetical protein COO60DRAFT_78118 [Scenedesmus sp. NREL 46B-D3]